VIVDTSALIAILNNEPDADRYIEALGSAETASCSAGTYLEAAIVIDGQANPVLGVRFDELIADGKIEITPVAREHAYIARHAYRDFGKGSGHPARLNFGDCFAYALARTSREPLLFKGDDFSHTDVASALD